MGLADDYTFGSRYEQVEGIGHGGVGDVFKAFDKVREEFVAIKELSSGQQSSPAAVLSLRNEFHRMSRFDHPNIAKVYDFGVTGNNISFLSMEFIPGKDLSDIQNPSITEIIRFLVAILDILDCIHSRLLVHRDLKPDNIRIAEDGTLKLIDYGLMEQLGVHASEKLSGTYAYLAPEAIVGGVIDESTDLYSLGIIGYELLTGSVPFEGDTREILMGHLKKKPLEPKMIRPDIPSGINGIIMKLLEKDKADRYRKCAEVMEDLANFSGNIHVSDFGKREEGYLFAKNLVGRKNETDSFRSAMEVVRAGKGKSVFFSGSAGVGKTRLLNELKIISQLEKFHSISLDAGASSLNYDEWLTRFAFLIESLYEDFESMKQFQDCFRKSVDEVHEKGLSLSPETAANLFLEYSVKGVGEDHLVIFFDDVQKSDPRSVQVMNEMIRNGRSHPILFIVSFRSGEVDRTSPVYHTVDERLSELLTLSPMSRTDTGVLISDLLFPSSVSTDFIDYCFRNSGGNVFDLMELLRYLVSEGLLVKTGVSWAEPVNIDKIVLPEKTETRLLIRIKNLDRNAKTLAEIAAVLGGGADLLTLREISCFDEETLFVSIETLTRSQILMKSSGTYSFCHDKIRSALYDNLPKEKKEKIHLETAHYLEKTQGDRPGKIARHFALAGDAENAIRYSLSAADLAEKSNAEWEAFDHFRTAARFLEKTPGYSDNTSHLLTIYEKAAQFSSAAWIDAPTCLGWIEKAIETYSGKSDLEKVFGLSLAYIVTATITGDYGKARSKIRELIKTCDVTEGSIPWAVLFGAGVCLVDWYQGYQEDCFSHASASISIFEKHMQNLPDDVWPAFSWALFWRDKARAYLGRPVDMANVENIRQMMLEGKSDQTIYWHTLTAVGARAAYTGRYQELLAWKELVSRLSREMGKIYWFECWISHSYLFGSLQHGKFSQLEDHIERLRSSPDPYQMRLSLLFAGMLAFSKGDFSEAERELRMFLQQEESTPDNSLLEGIFQFAKILIATGNNEKADEPVQRGIRLSNEGPCKNPFFRLRFLRLQAELLAGETPEQAEVLLNESLGLARKLELPIQEGFSLCALGMFLKNRDRKKEAEDFLYRARDLFLSIGNKYQAGHVLRVLEELEPSHGRKSLANMENMRRMKKNGDDATGITVMEMDPFWDDSGEEENAENKEAKQNVQKSDHRTVMGND